MSKLKESFRAILKKERETLPEFCERVGVEPASVRAMLNTGSPQLSKLKKLVVDDLDGDGVYFKYKGKYYEI